jgi:hypothetical protein
MWICTPWLCCVILKHLRIQEKHWNECEMLITPKIIHFKLFLVVGQAELTAIISSSANDATAFETYFKCAKFSLTIRVVSIEHFLVFFILNDWMRSGGRWNFGGAINKQSEATDFRCRDLRWKFFRFLKSE